MFRKVIQAGTAAALLAGATLLAAQSPASAASCSAYLTGGGHTAVGTCSGYYSTGTFRVVASACYSGPCTTVYGQWAYLQGGTSTVTSSAYLSSPRIQYGPNSG